jgi:hypothetical protein
MNAMILDEITCSAFVFFVHAMWMCRIIRVITITRLSETLNADAKTQ